MGNFVVGHGILAIQDLESHTRNIFFLRFVIDCRFLNQRTCHVQYPVPIADEFFRAVSSESYCVFTNLDLIAMYYQFLVDSNSARRYLAFQCPSLSRIFMLKRLPMGFHSSSSWVRRQLMYTPFLLL